MAVPRRGLASSGRVASLSMIATPNFGSPIADVLAGPKPSVLDVPLWTLYNTLVDLAAKIGLSLLPQRAISAGCRAGWHVPAASDAGSGAAVDTGGNGGQRHNNRW